MLTLILILAVVGLIVALVPMDSRIKTVIIVIACVWAIFVLFGGASLPSLNIRN